MNRDTPRYYQPYESGDESGNESGNDTDITGSEDYDSDNLPDYEDARIRREEDPRYALIRTAGPNFNTSEQQLKYMEHAPGSAYNNSTNITSLHNFTYLNPPKTTQTSLFSIKSVNRDATVFPSPFNFEIKTPRIYKNITKLQLVQISFPNNTQSFTVSPYFNAELIDILLKNNVSIGCISTCITLTTCGSNINSFSAMERGRLTDDRPFLIKFSIPAGVYTNETIADALNQTSNNTPPLNLISYQDFKQEFQTYRDISILFNEPGDKFYSHITKTQHYSHTKDTIMNAYYSQQHIDNFPIITDKIAFNAYYYPILKELFATNSAKLFIDYSPYTYEQAYDFILFKFLGLDSNIYYNLCLNNQTHLDNFRKTLTFEYTPINKYIWSYNTQLKQFNVAHNSLHTSLQNDITNKYNSYLNSELTVRGLNNRSFQTFKSVTANTNSVFKELESNLSTVLFAYGLGGNYSYTGGSNHITDTGTSTMIELHSDATFTSMFNYNAVFGKQFHSNFYGQMLTFTNFLDYHSTMSSYYNTVINNSSIISTITGSVNSNHHTYVSTKYNNILPYSMINNKSYHNSHGVPVFFIRDGYVHSNGLPITNEYLKVQSIIDAPPGTILSDPDPCITSCCAAIESILKVYYGCLPVQTITNNYPNSLGYRLGIPPFDFSAPKSLGSTIFQVTSTANFNVLLQLNTEYALNNMDIAMNEFYDRTNETTGQVDLMAAKILLQGVGTGEVSETAIQNPILFETPLGKLNKLTFKMYSDDTALTPLWLALPFDIGINEWDATFQIDEEIAFADRNAGFSGNIPTIPIPNNPNGFQYMALTSSNNPLNK